MASQNGTNIRISRELKEFLVKQAIHKDETYDQILKRLLNVRKAEDQPPVGAKT